MIKHFLLDNVSPFTSNIDGKKYEVREVGDEIIRQKAADYLAKLNSRVNTLVDFCLRNNLPDQPTAARLYNRWLKCDLKETSSNEKSAAYTLNKSSEIRICIRDNNGRFENINTSMFVLLHELAHVMSITYGHDEEFKINFSFITNIASNLGLYKPEDFKRNPKRYCGVNINTTPCSENTCKFNVIKNS